jgi:serine protease AprX
VFRVRWGKCAALAAAGLALAGGIASAGALVITDPDTYRAAAQSSDLASQGDTGSGVTVAVIDTGVANVAGMDGKVVHQENLSAAPDDGDQFGHGTFVAGLVHKTAPDANIVSLKLSGSDGSVDASQVLAALQWVIENKDEYGIDVVNLSFGTNSTQSWQTSPLNYAVEKVWDAGIVVVASAGNLGDGSGTITKPADDPLIISVGASDDAATVPTDDDSTPSFTSRGPTHDGLSKPDLVASGTRVVSLRAPGSAADNSYPNARSGEDGFVGSGTSFASPIVAGIVAQMLQAEPSLTPDQIKYALVEAARPIAADTNAQGAGMVSAADALAVAGTGEANQGVGRSSGTGSLQAVRGSFKVKVDAQVKVLGLGLLNRQVDVTGNNMPVLEDSVPVVTTLLSLLDGLNADVFDFVPADFLAEDTWDSRHWGSRHWGSRHWGSRHWGSTSWASSNWQASQWWATSWG